MLGRLYQIKGDRDKATQIYKQLLGVEPGSEEGVTALAKLHMDAGNYKEAVDLLEQFVKASRFRRRPSDPWRSVFRSAAVCESRRCLQACK